MLPSYHVYFPVGDSLTEAGVARCKPNRMATGAYWLSTISISEEFRGLGLGSELLDIVCSEADNYEVDLYLHASPTFKSPLNKEQLIDWYGRRGFYRDYDAQPLRRAFRQRSEDQVSFTDLLGSN